MKFGLRLRLEFDLKFDLGLSLGSSVEEPRVGSAIFLFLFFLFSVGDHSKKFSLNFFIFNLIDDDVVLWYLKVRWA